MLDCFSSLLQEVTIQISWLTLYLMTAVIETKRTILISLLTFGANFFYLFAAKNALPVGGSPAGVACYAADK